MKSAIWMYFSYFFYISCHAFPKKSRPQKVKEKQENSNNVFIVDWNWYGSGLDENQTGSGQKIDQRIGPKVVWLLSGSCPELVWNWSRSGPEVIRTTTWSGSGPEVIRKWTPYCTSQHILWMLPNRKTGSLKLCLHYKNTISYIWKLDRNPEYDTKNYIPSGIRFWSYTLK